MKKSIEYIETELFQKEFKKLLKKYRTLSEDFNTAKKHAIELFHLMKIDSQSVENLTGSTYDDIQVYKLRKFACKSLKGRGAQSGIRIIYAYHPDTSSITFLEIYFKGDKENEDRGRVQSFVNNRLNT